MYAIVNIQGQQFRVMENQPVIVHRLQANEGDQVSFEEVLLLDHDGSVTIGAPLISGAKITAKVLGHLRGDKVIVFKRKKKKNLSEIKRSPPGFYTNPGRNHSRIMIKI